MSSLSSLLFLFFCFIPFRFVPSQAISFHPDPFHIVPCQHILFTQLYTITNMPISRFLEYLVEENRFEEYMQQLVDAYNPAAVDGLMCRNMISVGWDGTLYDCDFNQMLDLPLASGMPRHISDFDREQLARRIIRTDQHCYGCTAGAGSSCQGTTA